MCISRYGILVFVMLFFYGCEKAVVVPREDIVSNMVRVFMHDRSTYTLLVKNPNFDELEMKCYHWVERIRIKMDVPLEQAMWAQVFWVPYGDAWPNVKVIKEIIIHIHSEKNIEGGAWDHGKLGRGTTNVIE